MIQQTTHGFSKLNFAFPGGVAVYELEQDGVDQAEHNTLRLNCYLSQDGEFVVIWHGLLDAYMTEISLGFDADPAFNFVEQYDEPLFRGYIGDDETGTVILKSLRSEQKTPNILVVSEWGPLDCHALGLRNARQV